MTQYEVYATIGRGRWNKGRYVYYGKTPVIPQLRAIIDSLNAEGRDVKVLTTYPNGRQCVSQYFAKREDN